jgi:hypothetical protein
MNYWKLAAVALYLLGVYFHTGLGTTIARNAHLRRAFRNSLILGLFWPFVVIAAIIAEIFGIA